LIGRRDSVRLVKKEKYDKNTRQHKPTKHGEKEATFVPMLLFGSPPGLPEGRDIKQE